MQQFFAEHSLIEKETIRLEGADVNHMKNVLRMKPGEEVRICNGSGKQYKCRVKSYENGSAILKIMKETEAEGELPVRIYLFQGLPKGDKMEWIVQKAVELGVYCVVPFAAKRSVVKLDPKKAEKKRERWQAIAKGAAEQSGRGIIPKVHQVISYEKALEMAKELDVVMIPYERAEGMQSTVNVMKSVTPGKTAGIFIGPEGGFEETEVSRACAEGACAVSLGKRILRTETAGLMALSVLMYQLESQAEKIV